MEYMPDRQMTPEPFIPSSGSGSRVSGCSGGSRMIGCMGKPQMSVSSVVGFGPGDDHVPGSWQEDTSECSLCKRGIGGIGRRHHCRICGRCVCGPCSPSTVQLEGVSKVQRACKACVASALRVPALAQRLGQLSLHLAALCGDGRESGDGRQSTASYLEAGLSLEDAAARCEALILPLEGVIVESQRRVEKAENEAAAAGFLVQRSLQGIKALPCFEDDEAGDDAGGPAPSAMSSARRRPPTLKELQEWAVSIDTSLSRISAELTNDGRRGGWGSRARSRSGQRSNSMGGGIRSKENSGHENSSVMSGERSFHEDEPSTFPLPQRKSTGNNSIFDNLAWGDGSNCSNCNCKLGKRVFKPRHHCRLCGRCVCSSCSPNLIMVKDEKQPVRVCTACVGETPQLAALTRKALDLGVRLAYVSGKSDSAPREGGLEQALVFCETAFKPLEEAHTAEVLKDAGRPRGLG